MKKLILISSLISLFGLTVMASTEPVTQCENEAIVALLNYLEKNNANSDWHLFRNDSDQITQLKDIQSGQSFDLGSVIVRGDVESYNFTDYTLIPYVDMHVVKLLDGSIQCQIQDVGIAK